MSDDEKIMPCPFCGSECNVACFDGVERFVICGAHCGYHSAWRDVEAKAIAAHNRVAKNMIGEKTSEHLCREANDD